MSKVSTAAVSKAVRAEIWQKIQAHRNNIKDLGREVKAALKNAPERRQKNETKVQAKSDNKVFYLPRKKGGKPTDTGLTVEAFRTLISSPQIKKHKLPKEPVHPIKPKTAKTDSDVADRFQARLARYKELRKAWRKRVRQLEKPRVTRIVKTGRRTTNKPLSHPMYLPNSKPGNVPFSRPGAGWINLYLRKQWYSDNLQNGMNLRIGPNTTPNESEWGNKSFLHALEFGGTGKGSKRSEGYFIKWVKNRRATTRSKHEDYLTFSMVSPKYFKRKPTQIKPRPFIAPVLKRIMGDTKHLDTIFERG